MNTLEIENNFYKNNFILKFLEILILILPFFLILSKLVSEIIIIFIIIFFIASLIIKKNLKYLKNKFFICFILWCLYLILGSLLSTNIFLSLESSLFFFRFGFLAFAIFYICENIKNFKSKFLYILLIIFFILFADSLIQDFFGYNIIGYKYSDNRISSFFNDEKILGSFISMFLPLLVGLLYNIENKNKYYFLGCILFISFIIIALSNERTALINYIFFSLIFIFSLSNNLKNFLLILLAFITIIFLTLFSNDNLKERIIDLTIKQIVTSNFINNNQNLQNFNFVPSVYQYYYNSSYEMFLDNKIFGIGAKNFRYMCKKEKYFHDNSCSTHPHHRFLQLLTETGIIGTIPIIFLFIYSFYKTCFFLLHINKLSIIKNLLFLYILIYLNPLLPSGNIFGSNVNLIFFLNIGFLLYMNREYK